MDALPHSNSTPSALLSIYHTSCLEYADASLGTRVALAGTLGGLAFEWGPANEVLLGMTAGYAYELTQNPVITGLATGAIAFGEQGAIGTLMAATIHQFPKVADSVRNVVLRAGQPVEQSRMQRFLESFALGASVSLAKENARRELAPAENLRHVLGSAAMIGGGVAAIGAATSSLLAFGSRVGLETQAEVVVDMATNPLTYIGLFAAKVIFDKSKRLIKRERGGGILQAAAIKSQSIEINATQNRYETEGGYCRYRQICDQHDGLLRTGIRDAALYATIVNDKRTVKGTVEGVEVPLVGVHDPFHVEGQEENPELPSNQNAYVPLRMLPPDMRSSITAIEQFNLDPEIARRIVMPNPEDPKMRLRDVPSMLEGNVEGRLLNGHGEAQFTVLAKYDVSACEAMRDVPPEDVNTRDGHILTTDKEKILANLPELIELHEAVFRRQAVRIGYYDGLVGDMIERLLARDDFIGAAAFDKETGKPFMFAIFASGLGGINQLPWFNQPEIEQAIRQSTGEEDPVLAMPLVITAKFNGLGVFSETAALAMHEILYRTQTTSTMHTLYNANLQSVLYTPRIINASAEQQGAKLSDVTVEASVITVGSEA